MRGAVFHAMGIITIVLVGIAMGLSLPGAPSVRDSNKSAYEAIQFLHVRYEELEL